MRADRSLPLLSATTVLRLEVSRPLCERPGELPLASRSRYPPISDGYRLESRKYAPPPDFLPAAADPYKAAMDEEHVPGARGSLAEAPVEGDDDLD